MRPTKTLDGADRFPHDDSQKIVALAGEYWSRITSREEEAERDFPRAFEEARSHGYLSKRLFIDVARWKSVRNTQRYQLNSETDIQEATAVAFRTADEATAIQALTALHGVALRTASAVLHWMRPERFPILDFRVVAALEQPSPKSYENIHYYIQIADQVRQLARRHSLDLRTIDRALWVWDKRRSLHAKAPCRSKRDFHSSGAAGSQETST